jgi:Carbohydrate-binding module 48 (Isoamylase N-terminal domain)
MVSDEQDEMIERLVARLRPLPEVDSAAKARVLVAVAAERERDRERRSAARRRARVLRWSAVGALAAAAAFSAFMLGRDRGASVALDRRAVAVAPDPDLLPNAATQLVSRDAGVTALQRVQLVFRAPAAHRVSVVGDFTGWDATRAVMTRDSGSGLWSVSLALAPGRHVYAFLVDDSVWVRDPRAPAAPDADFGRPGSVLLVGRP